MASTVGVAPALQALSLESSRRMSKPVAGNVGSTFSSSFLGEKCQLLICSSPVSQGPVSRSFHALCARMESSGAHSSSRRSSPDGDVISSWNGDKSRVFQSSSQRAAVATSGFVVAEDSVDVLGFRRDRKVVMEDQAGVGLSGRSDGRTGNVEEGIGAEDDVSDISRLGLKEELVGVLASRGITQLFPIQKAVLKPALKGIDVIGRARTGTGKTLAFGIPIIQQLLEQNDHNQSARRFGRPPRALVLAPTRELAMQVEKELMESAPNLSTICVYGGVSITAQQRKLQKGVDVAVGTPGRVIDLIEQGFLMLNEVKYMVLDEADRMLAVGFEEDVEKILDELPSDRQSMLFSATMPSWVLKLARKYLRSPLTIDLVGDSDEKLAEGIKIYSVATPITAKRSILNDLITVYGKRGKTIIFTQTKKDADEVSLSMTRMLGAEALHGDISQAQREKTLAAFRNGKFSVLVATDVAARGLDIPNVDLVIHYEIPNDPETFVHRSGRTGRAGKEGVTILMHSDSQFRTVRTIERDIGCKFEIIGPPNVNDVLRSSSEHAEEALSKVHPELKAVFLPTAEKLLKEKGVEAFAAAIAHLSGFTQPPASRSLITHEEGWMTLQITRSGMWDGRFSSVRNVMGAISSIYPRAADEVGKIRILDEQECNGAVFDLPEDIAKELLTKEHPAEDSIVVVSKLPRLRYDDEAPRDRYGRFPQRGGLSRMGSSGGRSDLSTWRRQDQRAFGTMQDLGFGRRQEERSKAWSDDWSVSRKQEWQPRLSRRLEERPKAWSDDWSMNRKQEERPKAWSDGWSMNRKQEGQPIFGRQREEGPKAWSGNSINSRKQEGPLDDNFLRVFTQICENCGQQGHRAVICPKRR